jgi:hypothetical protein
VGLHCYLRRHGFDPCRPFWTRRPFRLRPIYPRHRETRNPSTSQPSPIQTPKSAPRQCLHTRSYKQDNDCVYRQLTSRTHLTARHSNHQEVNVSDYSPAMGRPDANSDGLGWSAEGMHKSRQHCQSANFHRILNCGLRMAIAMSIFTHRAHRVEDRRSVFPSGLYGKRNAALCLVSVMQRPFPAQELLLSW